MEPGERFTRLTLVEPLAVYGRRGWVCLCDCGERTTAQEYSLTHGQKKSCGCLRSELMAKRGAALGHENRGRQSPAYRHGDLVGRYPTPEYMAYAGAKARCRNPKNLRYARYGGRGVEFRFLDFASFLAELGRRPGPGYSVDRVNNDGHYEVGNVRWADAHTQAMNKSNGRWAKAV